MIKDGMLSKEHMGYKIGSFWLWRGGKKQETVASMEYRELGKHTLFKSFIMTSNKL